MSTVYFFYNKNMKMNIGKLYIKLMIVAMLREGEK